MARGGSVLAARHLIAVLPLIAALASCTFEYDSMLLTEEEKAAIPDVRLEGLVERVYQDGSRVLELSSEELATYEARRIQEIESLEFSQYDNDGNPYAAGRADFASRDLDSDDILMRGNVEIDLMETGALLRGDEFLYSPRQDLIWSPGETEVELIQEDGSVIRGRGFIIDLALREIRFDLGATGILKEAGDE
jgi:LPS export ABC transporter protein LptC